MNLTNNLTFQEVMMNGIQDMVFIIDVGDGNEFIYRFLNQAAMNRTDLSNEVIGKSLKEVYPNELGDFLSDQYNKAIMKKDVLIYEDSYIDPSGKRKYSKTTLTPFFNDENRCISIVGVVKDVTEKKEAEIEAKEATRKLHESMQRYQSLYHYNLDAVTTIGLDGKIINGNALTEQITGCKLSNIIGESFLSLIVPEFKEITESHFEKAIIGESQQFQAMIFNKKREKFDIIVKFSPIIIDEKISGVFGVFKDITEQEETIRKLRESEERFRIITENAHELITLLNDQGKIIYASPSYKDILGANPDEYIGQLFLYNVHPDDRMTLDQAIITSIKEGKPCSAQFRQFHQEKGWIWCDLTGRPVFDANGQFVNMVVLTRDITLQKNYENSLKHFANHDTLTGLPNRRYFNFRLRKALSELLDNQDGLAVMMIDIDDFKTINDNYGHDIGDDVVVDFASRVSGAIRESDMVARLGGDEFVALLHGITKHEEALEVARKIHEAVEREWKIKNVELSITTSIGIAIAPPEGTTRSVIMKQADMALYEAKRSGKNCIKIVD
ncbi:diguanylate cyclase domain-containing protein [Bacillaceae bacterium W0354]